MSIGARSRKRIAAAEAERDTLLAERQKDQQTIAELQECLEPGKASAIVAAVSEIAKKRCGRSGYEAHPALLDIDRALDQRDSALATLRQVRLDVEAAPHAPECASKPRRRAGMTYYETDTAEERNAPWYFESGPCNCFKSRVLAKIDKALGPEQGSPE